MENLKLLNGLHPGIYLEYELKRRAIGKSRFALSVNEFPQTLVSITKGKRRMNTVLSLKIEKSLGLEEGFLMILQVFHDIKMEKKAQYQKKDPPKLRKILFWDTRFEEIDWVKYKKAIVKRVFERGNAYEKNELMRFYGEEEVNNVLN